MKVHEAKCVEMKRHGAKYVAKQQAGMSTEERLEFWRMRTDLLMQKQAAFNRPSKRA